MDALFLQALKCKNTGRPPIWLMRQAGRYMPEYRALRAKYSFLEMCHQPELAAQTTLLPIQVFGMDAAILFSDILVIAEALGVGLRFEEHAGPIIERPLTNDQDVANLVEPKISESLKYVADAIRFVKPQLNIPLIGFCGAPFTLASYMIEGKSSRDFKKTKQWMLRNPQGFHKLLELITKCLIQYLKMQIAAGVDAIQIFDSWAHVLAGQQFREFSLLYSQKIIQALNFPILLFCRGSSIFGEQMAKVRPAGISLDWQCDIGAMRRNIPSHIALQGNLDPDILYAPHQVIIKEAEHILNQMKGDKGFIFNLGHGMHPDIPVDAVKTLIDYVKSK